MKRRALLLSALSWSAYAVSGGARADARRRTPRLVVLDWGLIETLLALGVQPVGVAEGQDYDASVVSPLLPHDVADVGLRLAPSLEMIQQLAPDAILINSSQESQRALLERIAPVRAFTIYSDAGAPFDRSVKVTRELGTLCGCEAAAEALIARTQTALTTDRARLAAHCASHDASAMRPVYIIRFFDARHIGVYGARSLFQDVLDRLGVRNAWHGATDYWGIAVAGIEKLSNPSDADVLTIGPLAAGVGGLLASNRLWHALPAVEAGRVANLPPFWGFGMLPSAARFSRVLTDALLQMPHACDTGGDKT
ncbi:ABC transporter substrate-binding protein [Paraburkholderia sp. C35]|uniref:ABC transporter substrate-binding protein n=1 Tax=Paraburkholderia sp. C35 TaxID=2126993 RepID=UPI000D698CDF|nr:ABC transporter substrate-binding protein [Paraburkholderia sp. C35]